MPTFIYRINAGAPDFTAHIEPNVAADQVHATIGTYSFNNIPEGFYTVTVQDGMGCFATITQEFTTTTTTTTAPPTTTTTSTSSTTTTTTTHAPTTTTTTTHLTTTTTSSTTTTTSSSTTTTTTTAIPITTTTTTTLGHFVKMDVNYPNYDIPSEVNITYFIGTTNINTTIKSGYNFLFLSIPSDRTFIIRDSMNADITSLFDYIGTDVRGGYVTNGIWKKHQIYNSSASVPYSLTLT